MKDSSLSWVRRAGTVAAVSAIAASCGGSAEKSSSNDGPNGDGDTSTGNSSGDGDGDASTGNAPGDGDGDTSTGNAPGDGDGDTSTGNAPGDGDLGGASGDGDGDSSGGTDSGTGGEPGGGDATLPCGSDQDCKDAGLLCGLDRNRCVECISAADCGDLALCNEGTCLELEACQNSLDCSGTLVCDQDEGACYPCVGNNDCGGGQDCVDHACVTPCSASENCTAPLVCDVDAGYCQECLVHGDCQETEFCSGGACLQDVCVPGSNGCAGTSLGTCKEAGDAWGIRDCVTDCVDEGSGPECVGGVIDDCEFTIDTFDDGDGRICEGFGRSGGWFDWDDTDPILPTEGEGRTDNYGIMESFLLHKGIGLILNEVDTLAEAYDAGVYAGISFYHRESSGIAVETVQYLSVETNQGSYSFAFTTEHSWTRAAVSWQDLGIPPAEVSALRRVSWLYEGGASSGQTPDSVWLDDVAFY